MKLGSLDTLEPAIGDANRRNRLGETGSTIDQHTTSPQQLLQQKMISKLISTTNKLAFIKSPPLFRKYVREGNGAWFVFVPPCYRVIDIHVFTLLSSRSGSWFFILVFVCINSWGMHLNNIMCVLLSLLCVLGGTLVGARALCGIYTNCTVVVSIFYPCLCVNSWSMYFNNMMGILLSPPAFWGNKVFLCLCTVASTQNALFCDRSLILRWNGAWSVFHPCLYTSIHEACTLIKWVVVSLNILGGTWVCAFALWHLHEMHCVLPWSSICFYPCLYESILPYIIWGERGFVLVSMQLPYTCVLW